MNAKLGHACQIKYKPLVLLLVISQLLKTSKESPVLR